MFVSGKLFQPSLLFASEARAYPSEAPLRSMVGSCGLYYKPMKIINDDSRVVNKPEASLNDNARVVIYDRHMCVIQSTRLYF